MPSKKPTELWSAPPHTLAKLEILRNYLTAYFAILGRTTSHSREILYIDGFAGPNEYLDHSCGSLTVALTAAATAIAQAGSKWRAKGVKCVFTDKKAWIIEHCRRKLSELPASVGITHEVLEGRFDQVLPSLVASYPDHFNGDAPLFVFADPFGATGVPFASIKQILAADRSELFLNFDSDGLVRILKAQEAGDADGNLTAIFGDDSWRQALHVGDQTHRLARSALELFKQRLRSIPGVNYVFTFEMQKRAGIQDYHLVFASKNRLGLEKMKEAMRVIARDQGGFEFCDAYARTGSLFRFDRSEDYAGRVHANFAGKTVPADVVWDYVLNETLLVNAKGVLAKLEKEKVATIIRKPGADKSREREVMKSVTFTAGPYIPARAPAPEKGLFDGTQE